MGRNLRARLKRLERNPPPPVDAALPPDFFPVIWGLLPIEQADPDTAAMVRSLHNPPPHVCPIEERLAQYTI